MTPTATTDPKQLLPKTSRGPWSLLDMKVSKLASEESTCFEATVLEDGKPVAVVRNDGHGGNDYWLPVKGQTIKQAMDARKRIESYCRTLPPLKVEELMLCGELTVIDYDPDILISELLDGFLQLKNLKRTIDKGYTIAFDPKKNKVGESYTIWRVPPTDTRVERALKAEPTLILLNPAIQEARA